MEWAKFVSKYHRLRSEEHKYPPSTVRSRYEELNSTKWILHEQEGTVPNTLQEYFLKSSFPLLNITRISKQQIPLLMVDFHLHTDSDVTKSVKYAGHTLQSQCPAQSNASDDPKTDFNMEHTTSSTSGMHHGTCIQQCCCGLCVLGNSTCSMFSHYLVISLMK